MKIKTKLVVNAGVVIKTLIEDTVLTPQRSNLESEHSRSNSEARSEVDLWGSVAEEDEKKKNKTIMTM